MAGKGNPFANKGGDKGGKGGGFVPFQKGGKPGEKSGGKLSPEDIAKLEAKARKMPKGEAKDKLLQKIAMAKRMMGKGKKD